MKYFLFALLLLSPLLLEAKSFSYTPPSSAAIREAIIDVSEKTRVRSALLYGVLGQETAYGNNLGKTEAGWQSFCATRNTQDCQSWKTYDCKGEYRNARHFDEILLRLGFVKADGKADRVEIPVSSTCAMGLTQFEPNTWWGIFGSQTTNNYSPWSVRDALYAAALHLRDLGADGGETLSSGEVIGAKDIVALQKYYCGGYYRRTECVLYARGVERHARRAEKDLLIRDLKRQIEVLKLKRTEILLGTKAAPAVPGVVLPQESGALPPREFAKSSPASKPSQEVLRMFAEKPAPAEIVEQLSITPTTVPPLTLREPYSVTFTARGGKPPYVWSMNNRFASERTPAPLPSGLSLTPSGILSGTPTEPGNHYLALMVTDSLGNRAEQDIALAIAVPQMSSELRIRSHDGITDYEPTILKRKNGELVIVFVSYERDAQTGLFSMRSLDNGVTWSAPVFVYGQVVRSEITEDKEGNIVLFTKGGGYDEGRLLTLVSRDGGVTWGEKRPVDTTTPGNDTADSILFAADGYYYASYRVGGNDINKTYTPVAVVRSKDLVTWEPPVMLSSESPTGSEFPSALLQGADGAFYLSYLSRRQSAVVIAESRGGMEWVVRRTIPLQEPLHLNPSGVLIDGKPVFLYAEGCACGMTFWSDHFGAYWSLAPRFFAFSQGYIASDAVALNDGTLGIVASDFSPERDVIFAKTKKLDPLKW